MDTIETITGYAIGVITIAAIARFIAMMLRTDAHPPVIGTMIVMETYGRWGIEIITSPIRSYLGERTTISAGWLGCSLILMPLLSLMMARKRERSRHHEIIWLGAATYTPAIIAIEAFLAWRG